MGMAFGVAGPAWRGKLEVGDKIGFAAENLLAGIGEIIDAELRLITTQRRRP